MTARATVARGLRLLACFVDGSDPAALALSEALRAHGEARRALEAAERTRGVVAAMLREGAETAGQSAEAVVAAGSLTRVQVDGWAVKTPTIARARELLRDLAGEG